MHPGLVPGFSIEELGYKFGVDKLVFGVNAVLILAFVIWGVTSPETVSSVSSTALSWGLENFGWLFNVLLIVCGLIMVAVALSRFGNIKLGKDNEEPEYSRFSWVAMMFSAGIGVGIFFFGPSEPLAFYHEPPLTVEPHSEFALHQDIAQADFHWGFSPWVLYALVGGALAYSSYRRGRVTLISSLFAPLLKRTDGALGRTIDILTIVATLFGTAASLGIATLQIGEGISTLTGFKPSMPVLLLIIGVLTVGFVTSAVSGVSKGIRLLSNTNISLTFLAMFFVFVTGPTLFLINLLPSGILRYMDQFLDMSSRSLSWGAATLDFQAAWTAFYWAWWIAWAPFVGMFIARISRGWTIREFILVTIVVPTFVLMLAFNVFGGTAISFAREHIPGFDGSASPQQVLYSMVGELPFSGVASALVIVILSIFFITSADSASVVMGTMASKGDPKPNKLLVVFWGLADDGHRRGHASHRRRGRAVGSAVADHSHRHAILLGHRVFACGLCEGPGHRPRRHPQNVCANCRPRRRHARPGGIRRRLQDLRRAGRGRQGRGLGQDLSSLNKRQLREIRKDIGVIFQSFNLVDRLSVLENVCTGALGNLKGPRISLMAYPKAVKQEALEVLDRVGLADRAHQRADTLSGGQKQRVSIARALMQHPKILLADEPVAALDPVSSNQVIELMKQISREDNLTVISSLHQVQLAVDFADRIIGLQSGRVKFDRETRGMTAETAATIYQSVSEANESESAGESAAAASAAEV